MASKPPSSAQLYSLPIIPDPGPNRQPVFPESLHEAAIPPPALTAGSDLLRILASEDAAGDASNGGPHALLEVLIDGQSLGDPIEVTAGHAAGAWQILELVLPEGTGSVSEIGLRFVNDWSAKGQHRNLYVDEIRLGHALMDAEDARLISDRGKVLPGTPELDGGHTLVFDLSGNVAGPLSALVPALAVPEPPAAVGDVLTLVVSGDAAGGGSKNGPHAKFEVLIDGQSMGEVWEVSANHAAGEWQTIEIALATDLATVDTVAVRYVNDWARTRAGLAIEGQDRNLYVREIALEDIVLSADQAILQSGGGKTKPGSEALWHNGMLIFDIDSLVHPDVERG